MAGLETTPEMFDLRMSEEVRPLFDAVKKFITEEVDPHTNEFFRLGEAVKNVGDMGKANSSC